MSTTNYSVTDSNGMFLAEAISCIDIVQARQRAQVMANERGESVFLSERGAEETEEVSPS